MQRARGQPRSRRFGIRGGGPERRKRRSWVVRGRRAGGTEKFSALQRPPKLPLPLRRLLYWLILALLPRLQRLLRIGTRCRRRRFRWRRRRQQCGLPLLPPPPPSRPNPPLPRGQLPSRLLRLPRPRRRARAPRERGAQAEELLERGRRRLFGRTRRPRSWKIRSIPSSTIFSLLLASCSAEQSILDIDWYFSELLDIKIKFDVANEL